MLRLAFSTVACPEWTLERVARGAAQHGYEGVELRTFGAGSTRLACDPALTDPAKVRATFADHAVEIAGLGTSGRYDERVKPPVLGNIIGDPERSVRETKRDIDLAHDIGAPIVRVFGFELNKREKRSRAVRRIAGRLRLVCDDARHRGVRVAVENGGSFGTPAELAALLDSVESPLLGACWNVAAGHVAGADPAEAVRTLGARLIHARLMDLDHGRPYPLGSGSAPCRRFVETLLSSGYDGWLVYEWDRAWLADLPGGPLVDADRALQQAAETVYGWMGASGSRRGSRAVRGATVGAA